MPKTHILNICGNEPSTLDKLAQCTIAVTNANAELVRQEIRVVGFSWNIIYSDNVSNSHNAPLGGTTNWGGSDKDRPNGYPGFAGRVWIRYSRTPSGWGSDGMNGTLVHTGTGGGGSYSGPWTYIATQRHKKYVAEKACRSKLFVKQCACYSWDCKIFVNDWPLLADTVSKQHMIDLLKTNEKQRIVHQFEWNEPKTVEEDQRFIDALVSANKLLEIQGSIIMQSSGVA